MKSEDSVEIVRLTLERGEVRNMLDLPSKTLVLESHRSIRTSQVPARKYFKYLLATHALNEITGTTEWKTMALKKLKASVA